MPITLLRQEVSGLTAESILAGLDIIAAENDDYGKSSRGCGVRVLFEYVSANPNGPLTIAHGRGGVVGDTLARLYAFIGYEVSREFYVNDATSSAQMTLFARSVWARYRQIRGETNAFLPEDGYSGEYVTEIARSLAAKHSGIVETLSDAEALPVFEAMTRDEMLARQKDTLGALGVEYDTWFSESELHRSGAVTETLAKLRASENAYQSGGALWLRSSRFGDDNDRVLLRAIGNATYLSGDLAYHNNKFARGFTQLVNVWGADHSGYVGRTKAGLAALGFAPESLHIALCQPVRVIRDGAEVKEWGGGNGVTLKEVLREAGRDALRFFLLQNAPDAPLDVDLDRARRVDGANPLYRVRAAFARAAAAPQVVQATINSADTRPFSDTALAMRLLDFPLEVEQAATRFAPHQIVRYAVEIADLYDAFCTRTDADAGSGAALPISIAVRVTLSNALRLLGVSPVGDAVV